MALTISINESIEGIQEELMAEGINKVASGSTLQELAAIEIAKLLRRLILEGSSLAVETDEAREARVVVEVRKVRDARIAAAIEVIE